MSVPGIQLRLLSQMEQSSPWILHRDGVSERHWGCTHVYTIQRMDVVWVTICCWHSGPLEFLGIWQRGSCKHYSQCCFSIASVFCRSPWEFGKEMVGLKVCGNGQQRSKTLDCRPWASRMQCIVRKIGSQILRAAQAQTESGVNFCRGKSKSLSRCSLGCVARSSCNRNG